MSIKILSNRLEAIEVEQKMILAKSGELLTADDQIRFDSLTDESDSIKQELARIEEEQANSAVKRLVKPDSLGKLPATPKRNSLKCFSSAENARNFGLFVMGHVLGNPQVKSLAEAAGISASGMLEDNNMQGGYLVPTILANEMIRLVEERGIFRNNSRTIELTSKSIDVPRRSAGSTAYYIGEASAITSSNMTIDLVTLTLKKLGIIVPVSSELANDAVISVFDMLAEDIAYQLADAEDEAGFNGDGSGTYGGILGVRQQLIEKALGGTAAGAVPAASGLVRYDTGNGYANIGIDDLTALIGKLPSYAEAGAKFYMSKTVWSYCLDLMADAGGNTIMTLSDGSGYKLLGYPVQITDVMPKSAAVNQVCVLLGDLSKASMMGLQKGIRMDVSNSATIGSTNMFETDQVAIRGIERFDVNVHDVGSTTAAGPVVGLISHTA